MLPSGSRKTSKTHEADIDQRDAGDNAGSAWNCVDALESRTLLDAPVRAEIEAGLLLALSEEQPVMEAAVSLAGVATRAPRSARVEAAVAAAAVTIDAAAVRAELVRFVDTWNGGQLGKNGTSGMGTYTATWDGLFRINLDREFNRFVNTYTDDMTIISQSRAIYLNVEAHRNAPAADQARFNSAVQKGADYLLGKSFDHNTYSGQPGGMWWGLQPDGVSPPTHTTQIGGTPPRHKHAYGQVQTLFALAHAYSVTGDIDHLNGAFAQLDVWNTQFADTAAGPGAFLQTANESYSQRIGNRNVDYMTHALEALLTLDEVTPASNPRKASLATQITNIGNFITTRMYRDAAGSTTMGYLPWWYDAQWNPSSATGEQFSTPGHNFEMAFLLSRAVERGFNPAWLDVANKLLAYTLTYSFDNVPTSPTYGAVPHEKLAFNGARFDGVPDDLVWWQQSEAARTLLHFAAVRGRTDLWDEYVAASAFIQNRFIDPVYGGWYQYLYPSTLAPTTTVKGSVWTGGYHETMLDAERIRVAPAATSITLSASADAYVRDGSYSGTNYGTAVELQVKRDSVGWNRESYLTFSLSGLTAASTAKLRLFGKLQSTIGTVIPVGVYGATSTNWSETSVNWNTRPSTGATALATQNLPDSTARWYEWDVSAFVRDQLALGKTAVTFALKTSQSGTAALFNSDEAATNKPQLVITTDTAVPQALVVSTSTVNVAEGGIGQFTVNLATQPTGDVTVSVSRASGDSDVTVSAGSTLLFTPANWNVPQQVTLAAAQDADAVNSSAVIQVTSLGLDAKSVTATEVDDDAPAAPVTLRASADAFVRNGTYATTNYGGQTTLSVKNHPSAGYTRESYLRFDLATAPAAIGSAKLRLFGNLTETVTGGVAMQVYGLGNASWDESGITWNNRPAPTTGVLVTKTITGTAGAWYEIDLTAYLQQQKSVGAAIVTLLLRNAVAGNAQCFFQSDEATANRPELVITPAVATPVGVIVSTPTLAVPEGGTAAIDVRLAAPPTSSVTVSITKQSGGDTDLNAAKSTLTFTPASWSVAQSVNVTAAQDADSTSGSAVYVLSLTGGGTPASVVASEIENDLAATSTVLRATDDAYVRGGTYATTNFGAATDLVVKYSSSTSNIRETYVSFTLSGVADVSTATLRLYGRLSASTNPSLVTTVHGASGAAWTESGINWNNRPAADATSLGTVTVAGTTGKWYELNVTAFVQAEKAAGRTKATFVLRNHTPSDAQTLFNSDEATANRPELVVTTQTATPQDVDTRLMSAVGLADQQLRLTLSDLGTDPAKYVRVTTSNGKWDVVDASTWTSAMLPGSLWYMAKMTGNAYWTTEAIRRTLPLEGQKTQTDDLAFRLAYAYWPLCAATGNAMYRQVLIDAAASRVAMFNPIVGAFESPYRASTSGDQHANFGVLMDQITDVELVLWAAKETNNADWTDKAVRHLQTLANHVVRADGSTYQWTYFDRQTGDFVCGEGVQGYSANSTWSRGQAWAIYGFTAAYRQTGRAEFLATAKKVSDWYLAHLPAGDMVPYWDFNSPDIPNTYKDSSAAAVAAAGFAELATLTPDSADAAKYRKAAEDTLFQLASPAYLSDGSTRGVLLHGAWYVPPPIQVGDSSTIWGDYFFLEAISRYMAGKFAG